MRNLTITALLLAGCGPDKFEPWTLEELPAERGFSLRSPDLNLPEGAESQICYFIEAPDIANGQPYYISRVDIAQNPGSHHLNVFRVNTIINLGPEDGEPMMLGSIPATFVDGKAEYQTHPCWDSSNWADWPLIANSQDSQPDDPYYHWQLPENVGIKITPGEKLMVQSHYVNYGKQITPYGSKFGINFNRFPDTAAPMEMGSLFATQQSIRICESNPAPTFSGTCRFPAGADITIEALNGHFHSRGDQFRVYTWDGVSDTHPTEAEHIYTSADWNEPPMATNVQRLAPSGGGVWWDCQYQWHEPINGCDSVNEKDKLHEDDCCYTFGGNVDVGEHCNLFLYYYPRVENQDVFCN